MAATQRTLFFDAPTTPTLATVLINPFCRRGENVNHSCRQCLKRTLEAWGYDADAYDAWALRETNKQRSKIHRQQGYGKGDPEIAHKNRRWKYGLTAQAFMTMLTEQRGVCALCRQPETTMQKGTLRSLAVDHDHATGQVRGLLCNTCNQALGWIERLDTSWLKQARRYLVTHGQATEAPAARCVMEKPQRDPTIPQRKYGGRPPKLTRTQQALTLHALENPLTNVTELAAALGVHRSTIYRTRTRSEQ